MIINLHVRNFALIEEAEIDFTPGLNVLTGETGAGKSILIDAVSSVLGLRTGAEVIRRGADHAYVEIVFGLTPAEEDRLKLLNIEAEYGCIIISRKILPGRSIFRINDETVTSQTVRRVTEQLLDIHGQHEHQSLLKSSRQREILDELSGAAGKTLRQDVREAYDEMTAARKTLEAMDLSPESRSRRMDQLAYEIRELEEAGVRPGEEAEIKAAYRTASQSEKICAALSEASRWLGSNSAGSAGDSVSRAVRALRPVAGLSERLSALQEQLSTLEGLLNDAAFDTGSLLEESAYDGAEVDRLEKRLDLIGRLCSKYRMPADELSSRMLGLLRAEYDDLAAFEERYVEAETALKQAEASYQEQAQALHQLREESARRLEEQIVRELSELNFLSVRFEARLTPAERPGPEGIDNAEYLISLNPGQLLQPLEKVASGGELSRIMLGIKTILADKDEIGTVIFDEIDAGISGRTAQMVGRKLKEISRYRQVILITHLPQIAALADTHIGIEKSADENVTRTAVRVHDAEGSLQELVRLMGGDKLSDSLYRAARELRKL